ncbi:LytTR family DNA-binding domain-containing protein [Rheinheimera sp. MMS21-TC3]|uniref:LytR/AlgR family response regulator transcription factor n=1 Tax=Rheinheimera sp. MMS21-TC3 TaxID=3072790 RepID=UPI0028C3E1D3|nr:LytTR family DNA-binding domain-containing protein [Rheinheimera sp. MMS21-TC3]WNO59611.1 LytTR family DNA-binding domain-containing protein [Rheinheimera sp. MMS21-TC3]
MFNVVIIEDEPLARSKLQRLLQQLADPITVLAELTSVAEVDAYFVQLKQQSIQPDLIFSDIELSDGNVFSCNQHNAPACPLIFITAYDRFMLPAFDSFGIAYLLKPYNLTNLAQAWQKFRTLTANKSTDNTLEQLQTLLKTLPGASAKPEYLVRIPIRHQQQIYFLDVADIVYIQADGGLIMAFDQSGKRHYLPYSSLAAVEGLLDPDKFMRINRSEMVQAAYIDKLVRYCKNTLSVYLTPLNVQLKTSQSRTSTFTSWLGL